MEEDQPQTEL
jgi:hypothetical protein